ncbi:hypothetical protein [Pseudoalteromonas luteoviolacea]|uniref:hypothetical protein n=1 Tax=Pseudoalteromonas luteoviolacea TaxID=43657 RepID=UPI0007B16524|nr:hypothetical protein [Pseudoalteromonas luteoviolacea]AOT07700.1 hypothetical protein S4054249_07505 [Pseudoalteromonas luteoviolacea]AOT12616.1 hypothetical protein S40542_07505 [Pseudoalteromonas luteoviolacea]AOT17530.1 hypothetical protein S4054_07505 [Pseudoalteromonas luteoviolacea]KZN78542.1 hypothetical protein N481_26015 [Pseudoalteromonas luteoviolacea S4047-1]
MNIIISFLLLIISSNALASAILQFPKLKCSTGTLQLNIVDVSFCPLKSNLERISFLGLTEKTVTILNNGEELTIGLNPPDISISNLHKKFNLTVHEFFLSLYEGTLKTDNLGLIKKAFDIDKSNKMKVYKKGNLFAFTITGSNVEYDRVYLNKIDSDMIYQITGEFDEKGVLDILSRIEY